MTLKLQFYAYTKKANQNISDYLFGLKSIAHIFATINFSINEKNDAFQALNGILLEYDSFVTGISHFLNPSRSMVSMQNCLLWNNFLIKINELLTMLIMHSMATLLLTRLLSCGTSHLVVVGLPQREGRPTQLLPPWPFYPSPQPTLLLW